MEFFHEYHGDTEIKRNNRILFKPHLHYEIEIIIMFSGHTTATLDGVDFELQQGDALIVFPNIIHSYKEGADIDVGKIIISPDKIPEFKEAFKRGVPDNPVIKNAIYERSLAEEIIEDYNKSSSAVQKGYLLLLVGKLLEGSKISERKSNDYETLNLVLNFCQKNFRSKITEKSVANALHLSGSYLSHIFSEKVDIGFCKYINTLRINEACNLLQSSKKSITEISEECGFGSIRSFNRAFSELRGMTPREYKNAKKKIE